MNGVYYNEIDEYAAAWLRNLIAAGHIAPGVVDTRSIEDVRPDDLREFDQCHFFAGIGGWSIALRDAGWPDNRPVWTGSCPCQPFSEAGQGAGLADERHLWPHFHHLAKECRPAIILGEQVASKDAGPWIDLVQADMEALDYAFGAIPFPSASIGAPHIRDRLYWVADTSSTRPLSGAQPRVHRGQKSTGPRHGEPQRLGAVSGLADADRRQFDGIAIVRGSECNGEDARRSQSSGEPEPRRQDDGLQFPDTTGPEFDTHDGLGWPWEHEDPGPLNGFWRTADWLGCTDGKWRPVEPGTFPLAHGLPAGVGKLSARVLGVAELAGLDGSSLKQAKAYRVGSLRGYGNALNKEAARIFIQSVMEAA